MKNITKILEFDYFKVVLAENHHCMVVVTDFDGCAYRDEGKSEETGHLFISEGVEEPGSRR